MFWLDWLQMRVAIDRSNARPTDPSLVGIDYEMVWGVVTTKVKDLDRAVRTCLETLDQP